MPSTRTTADAHTCPTCQRCSICPVSERVYFVRDMLALRCPGCKAVWPVSRDTAVVPPWPEPLLSDSLAAQATYAPPDPPLLPETF
jgi:hypothetical protein